MPKAEGSVLSFGFDVEIWGDYACFTRPEPGIERVSYDIITPGAARGILEAVLWRPAIGYVIDRIAVCSPIRFSAVSRNEFDFGDDPPDGSDRRVRRTTESLRNVRYVVSAHFDMTDKAGPDDNSGKFMDMIRRRLEKGQYFHAPYLGIREFPAKIRLINENEKQPQPIPETRTLGRMLYDMDYVKESDEDGAESSKERSPKFFNAVMRDGVIDLRNVELTP